MIELVPYVAAAWMLVTAFFMFMWRSRPFLGIVVALYPLAIITIDQFVHGNQTEFRQYAFLFYAFLLILAFNYNIKRNKL